MSWRTRMCQQLHQHCFYPRAIQTPADAIFVPRLIRFMHDIATPHFTSLFAYGNVGPCAFQCIDRLLIDSSLLLGLLRASLRVPKAELVISVDALRQSWQIWTDGMRTRRCSGERL